MSAAKAILALTLVGGITVGTTFLLTSEANGNPSFHLLFRDSDYAAKTSDGGDYKNKYGEKYSRYLVGITTKKDETTLNNETWWNWSFANRYTPNNTKEEGFATGITSGATLKDACFKAYKGTEETSTKESKFTHNSSSTKYKEAEIWKYCSPIGQKPTTISSRNGEGNKYTNNNIGGASNHNTKLISVEDEGNKVFWELRQKEFFEEESGTFSGKTANNNNFFKKFYEDNKDKGTNRKQIKERCKEAYSLPHNTSTSANDKPTPTEVIKYCSLTGS